MNQKELIKRFGNPVLTTVKGGEYNGWCVPNPQWCAESIEWMNFLGEDILCNTILRDRLECTEPELTRVLPDWFPEQLYCWSPRRKSLAPRRGLSMHAFGLAIDVDWEFNPYGKAETTLPDEFIEVMLHYGFDWGGYWKTPDPMHFELSL